MIFFGNCIFAVIARMFSGNRLYIIFTVTMLLILLLISLFMICSQSLLVPSFVPTNETDREDKTRTGEKSEDCHLQSQPT